MKKAISFGAVFALLVVGLCAIGYADATFTDPAVSVAPGATLVVEKSPFTGQLGGLLETVILAVISGLGALIGVGVKFLMKKMEGSNTRNILRIASAAVHYAEQKFGSDTGAGAKKKEEAIAFVMSHFKGVSHDQAEKFVGAAYSAIFTGLSPLDQSPAAKPPIA